MTDAVQHVMILRLMNAPNGAWPTPVELGDHICTIDYASSAGPRGIRAITMHRARQGVASVMIEATCHRNGPGRVFRLDRIRAIIDTAGRTHDAVEYFCRTFGVAVAYTAGPREAPRPTGPLSGHGVAFTGHLDRVSRADVKDIVETAGGQVFGKIVAGVTILVVGNAETASARTIATAKKAGLRIVDEVGFLSMVEGG